MKQIIFIASLIHSGSTLLALMLGGHSRLIGLGEISQVIKDGPVGLEKTRQVPCSCGQLMDACPFWSQITPQFQSFQQTQFANRYQMVLNTFERVFGPEVIPVDSSKAISHLAKLHHQVNASIKVLYLIRDVRSFTISHLDDLKRKGGEQGWRQWVKRTAFYTFWWWYGENRRMQRFFAEQQIQVFQIGYEELCLYPELMLQKLCDFLGEAYEPAMLALQDSQSHIIRGNRMRYQKEKSDLTYDHRWFLRREWMLPALLFPNILRYNRQHVYRNETEAIWRR